MELVLDTVRKTFGGVVAVDDVSAVLPQDKVTALIGPNGAGKTTLFNAITGFDPPDRGSITFGGQRIDGLPPCGWPNSGSSGPSRPRSGSRP